MASPENNCKHVRSIKVEYSVKKPEIAGSTLKIIALVTMLIDHIAATLLLELIRDGIGGKALIDVYWVMRSVGRMAFPIYCFLLVEGFKYTSDRTKYALRLFCFAAISEIPFDMAFNGGKADMSSNNVFFTLFIGLLTIIVIDWIKAVRKIDKSHSTIKWLLASLIKCVVMMAVILIMMILAEFVVCSDYGAAGIGCIVIMYLLMADRELAFGLGVILLGFLAGDIEFIALFMVIPIHFYNGKRGMPLKYFFYAFYPVHLLLLSLLTAGVKYLVSIN